MSRIPLPTSPAALWRAFTSLCFAVLALAASGAAWADPPGRVGRIADTNGTVWLFDDEDGEWIQPRRNRPVTEGDRLSAERGARAEVQIGATTLRLDGGTDIEFAQLNDERVHVRLHGGTVALRTRGDTAREVVVLTDQGRYEPLRAGRYRVDANDNGSFGAALTGALRFEARDSVLDIAAGQRAEFWSERGATHYAWAQPADDRFAEWVAREDREDDRERERHRYVSPEMTGSDDLDRYGRWDRHPDYGAIWWPTTVSVGWAPYRYGHWAYVRPWGYTWVDDAPWGFAPFHYGRWVNWNGRWGWCPGQYVARPVYAPALVAWFGGSNVSVGVSIGGPSVGWVPLAPREIYYPSYQVTNVYVRNVNVTHRHWHGRDPRYERTVPTGPIMYTNQGVAGGVTVVPQGVMRGRQPVGNAVVPVDSRTVARWQAQPAAVPVAPPSRVVATPGGAVPAAPGAVRTTPWTAPGRQASRGDRGERGDGGESHQPQRGGRDPRAVAMPERPAVQAPRASPQPQALPQVGARDMPDRRERDDPPNTQRRERGGPDDEQQRHRSRESVPDRRAAPQVVQPVQPPVQPAQPQVAPPPRVQQPVMPAPPPQGMRGDDRRERGERVDRAERNDRNERAERGERGNGRGDDDPRGRRDNNPNR